MIRHEMMVNSHALVQDRESKTEREFRVDWRGQAILATYLFDVLQTRKTITRQSQSCQHFSYILAISMKFIDFFFRQNCNFWLTASFWTLLSVGATQIAAAILHRSFHCTIYMHNPWMLHAISPHHCWRIQTTIIKSHTKQTLTHTSVHLFCIPFAKAIQ